MAINLPHALPGKTVQITAMMDAQANWEDVWYLQDDGSTWHSWYRPVEGWNLEHLAKSG